MNENWNNKKEQVETNIRRLGKKVKWIGIGVIIVAAVGIFAGGGTYTINEQQQAVITTLGIPKAVVQPGLHFKIPFIQKVKLVDTTIQGFPIGYRTDGEEEEYEVFYDEDGNPIATNGNTVESESLMITSDYNFVNVDFFVEYKVSDPVKAVYASKDPVTILKNIAQSCIRNVIGSYDVDSVLTTGKNEIQNKIKDMILNQLELHDIGLSLVNITIQDSEPPTQEVMEAFKAVETAKQGKETALNNAEKYQNEKMPQAQAQVDKIKQEAESAKQARINEANAEVAKFNAMYEEYIKNPEVTKKRLFYETMEELLPDLKVIIDGSNGNMTTLLPLDSLYNSDKQAASSSNNTEKQNSSSEEDASKKEGGEG
ncbi:MAG: FtsH protease activity modulator HflK [Candidatus Fimimorpha sp.]